VCIVIYFIIESSIIEYISDIPPLPVSEEAVVAAIKASDIEHCNIYFHLLDIWKNQVEESAYFEC